MSLRTCMPVQWTEQRLTEVLPMRGDREGNRVLKKASH